jgi:protein-disulfide isomerase
VLKFSAIFGILENRAASATDVRPGGCIRIAVVMATSVAMLAAIAFVRPADAANSSNPVLAEVGKHKITQQEVDSTIKVQLYDARKQALDQLLDDYLLKQAARKQNLSVDQYVKREVDQKVAAEVNEATAKKFYDENKDKIPALKQAGSFDKIKDRLIAALRQRDMQQQQEQLLARLRKESGAKVLLQAPRVDVKVSGADNPTFGPNDAPVKVVEFADFQCPFCKRSEEAVKAIREKYGNRVQLVFMDFPLTFHPHAMPAANAARCAQAQGKFWEYHDSLFQDQAKLDAASLKATAKKLGLDTGKFNACFDKNQYAPEIDKDVQEGHRLNVNGTPTFFIDGRELVGAQPTDQFVTIIDEELAKNAGHGAKTASAD